MSRKTDRELLAEALDALERAGCQFAMCNGPFRPQIYMQVCSRCSTVYAIRRRLKMSVKVKREVRDEAA